MAIALNPGHCRAYYNRAFSYDRLGHFEEAVADYSKALQIEPSNATALHNRGSLFERLGRCDECRDCSQLGFISQSVSATAPASCHRLQCSTWIAKDVEVPHIPSTEADVPIVCTFTNRLQDALQDFNAAIATDPTAALSFNSRALLLERLGQPEAALADHAAAVALDPSDPGYIKARGLCHRTLGKYEAAAQDFTRWVAVEVPRDASAPGLPS